MQLIQQLSSNRVFTQTEAEAFEVSVFTISNTLSALSGLSTLVDSVFISLSSGSVWNSYVLTAGTLENPAVFTNMSPTIATLSSGLVSRITDGIALIKANVGPVITPTYLDMSIATGTVVDQFSAYSSGSMSDILSDNLISLLSSRASVNYFLSADNTTNTFQKSLTSWISDIDLTAISVSTDAFGTFNKTNNGTLITPRHIVGVKHWNVYYPTYSPASGWVIGTRIRFCDSSNTIHERIVSSVVYLEDVAVGTLNEDLPNTVTPMKIMGEWFTRNRTQLTPSVDQYYIGGLGFHMNSRYDCYFAAIGSFGYTTAQKSTATINGSAFTYERSQGCQPKASIYSSNTPNFLSGYNDYYNVASGGDSGNPFMAILSGSPVMLWPWQQTLGGPPIWTTGLLNALIAEADDAAGVSTGYTVTVATNPT